jgi:polyisoprenoid-binding protein YceI
VWWFSSLVAGVVARVVATAALAALPLLQARAQQTTDSVVYHLDPSTRLDVKTGKAGLFSFAGHTHVIRARAVTGQLVYFPHQRARSHLSIKVPTESLQVLTPNDTAEIRKVTEAMRTVVLHVDQHPWMTFVADGLTPANGKMNFDLAVTMEGTTRKVPVSATVAMGPDTLTATGNFTALQTDFGIKPYKGGPAGAVKVADKVTFCFELVALKTPGPARPLRRAREVTDLPGCVDSTEPVAPERRVM